MICIWLIESIELCGITSLAIRNHEMDRYLQWGGVWRRGVVDGSDWSRGAAAMGVYMGEKPVNWTASFSWAE
jgi:hypothetical protein